MWPGGGHGGGSVKGRGWPGEGQGGGQVEDGVNWGRTGKARGGWGCLGEDGGGSGRLAGGGRGGGGWQHDAGETGG